jgi:hypothetical protein
MNEVGLGAYSHGVVVDVGTGRLARLCDCVYILSFAALS